MKVACFLMPLHANLSVSATINNPNCILVGLCAMCYKALEMEIRDPMPSCDMIKVLPKDYLSILVLGLEVVAENGHDSLISPIIDVIGHSRRTIDAIDVIGHVPCMHDHHLIAFPFTRSTLQPEPTLNILNMKTLSDLLPWLENMFL